MEKQKEYDAANHDFTIRHFLQNSMKGSTLNINQSKNTSKPIQHLWNTATAESNTKQKEKLSKSYSEPIIPSHNILEATKSFKTMPTIQSEDINECKDENEPEYTVDAARQIVNDFANRFPTFKPKLMEQFPNEWVNTQQTEKSKESSANQLFQFSHLERAERERIIQALHAYGPTQKEQQK